MYNTPNSTRFIEHLLRKHNIRVLLKESAQKVAMKGSIAEILGKQVERQTGRDIEQERHLKQAIKLPEFKEALARLITIRNLPHTLLDWPEFWAVILAVNYCATDIIKVSRKDVPNLIESTFTLHREALILKLHNAPSWIHYSLDMWTAPSKTAYLAIVSHFIDPDTQKSATALISLRELKGTHGGEAMGQVFLEVIEEYGLKNKIGFFTMDNAGSNDTMLQYIASQIPDFDPIIRRV